MEYVHFPLYPLSKKQSPINASLNRKFGFFGKKKNASKKICNTATADISSSMRSINSLITKNPTVTYSLLFNCKTIIARLLTRCQYKNIEIIMIHSAKTVLLYLK